MCELEEMEDGKNVTVLNDKRMAMRLKAKIYTTDVHTKIYTQARDDVWFGVLGTEEEG